MTTEEAKIVLLEAELRQARNCIEFMHGCLTQATYKYAHPSHTIEQLAACDRLAPPREHCIHSMNKPGCKSCGQRAHDDEQLRLAKQVLEL